MKNKKGFTLVEIIVVIVLLSVIAGIFILNMTGAFDRSKQNEDNETRNTVVSAAKAYVTSNPEKVENLYRGFSYVDIKIGELRDEGYLQEDLKSASTGEIIPDGKIVRVTYNKETDDVDYDFIEEGEAVELTRYDLVAEPISLKHNQNAVGNWCEQNYKYGYYADNADSKMYFVDESNKKVPQPEDKITLTLTNNCDVNLTRVGKYKIEYKYTYEDNGETITSTKIRNVYVVPDQFNVVFHENAINNITKQPAQVTNMPGNEDVTWSQEYTFPNKTPQRTGYTFEYWSYESNKKSEVTYQPNQTLIFKPVVTGNTLDLYAIWLPNIYQINLDNQSATTAGTTVIYEIYEHNYALTNSRSAAPMTTGTNKITIPYKAGYDFQGYYTKQNGTGVQFIDKNGYLTSNASTVQFLSTGKLYAYYTPGKFKVSFRSNASDVANPADRIYTYNSSYGSLPSISRTGYNFLGWYTASSGGTKITTSTIFKEIADGQILYAHWQIITYTLSFNNNGGSGGPSSVTANYGKTATIPYTYPSKGGYYSFVGWSTSSNSSRASYYAGSSYGPMYSDATLYAVYTYNPPPPPPAPSTGGGGGGCSGDYCDCHPSARSCRGDDYDPPATSKCDAVCQMEKNSAAWWKADAKEKERLHKENERLAKEVGAKPSGTGGWKKNGDCLYKDKVSGHC